MRQNAERMKHTWENYSVVAKQLLADTDYGFFAIAEKGSQITAFCFYTYEWSDWRDGIFYWIQGLESATPNDLDSFKAIKTFTEGYKGKY
jgi:hypothetical protein